MGQWNSADEYDGQVREITFRTKCNSPMCPPDTAVTEYQHAVLSPDKRTLVILIFHLHFCNSHIPPSMLYVTGHESMLRHFLTFAVGI